MSDLDTRYARIWDPFIMALMTLALVTVVTLQLRSEIRNLQRRVGQSEQQCK